MSMNTVTYIHITLTRPNHFGDSLLVVQQVASVLQCLEGLRNAILINALTSLHILLNFKFSKFQGMKTVVLIYWLNKHQALTSMGIIFISKKNRCEKINAGLICHNRPGRILQWARPVCSACCQLSQKKLAWPVSETSLAGFLVDVPNRLKSYSNELGASLGD